MYWLCEVNGQVIGFHEEALQPPTSHDFKMEDNLDVICVLKIVAPTRLNFPVIYLPAHSGRCGKLNADYSSGHNIIQSSWSFLWRFASPQMLQMIRYNERLWKRVQKYGYRCREQCMVWSGVLLMRSREGYDVYFPSCELTREMNTKNNIGVIAYMLHHDSTYIFLHAKPWILGGEKSIFTIVIH